MTAAIARIIARYLSGALVAYGLIPQEVGAQAATDPDIILALGAVIGIITEAAYALAVKKGWVKDGTS